MDVEILSATLLWCLPPHCMLLHCLMVNTDGRSEEGVMSADFFPAGVICFVSFNLLDLLLLKHGFFPKLGSPGIVHQVNYHVR